MIAIPRESGIVRACFPRFADDLNTWRMPVNENAGLMWLIFAILTVCAWGLYGVFLHTGQLAMGDPVHGRYKAFLFVGLAYFLMGILAPVCIMASQGASWAMPAKGVFWSLAAGIVGAIGAFGVLLAFGAKGSPAVVMSIVFAGAPIVNAIVAICFHPPAGGLSSIRLPFYAGILLAALGGALVTLYKPPPGHPGKPPADVQAVAESPQPGTE